MSRSRTWMNVAMDSFVPREDSIPRSRSLVLKIRIICRLTKASTSVISLRYLRENVYWSIWVFVYFCVRYLAAFALISALSPALRSATSTPRWMELQLLEEIRRIQRRKDKEENKEYVDCRGCGAEGGAAPAGDHAGEQAEETADPEPVGGRL
jgi:hypothetical protein